MNEKKKIEIRTIVIGVLFGALYITIGARAFYLHIFCNSWLPQKAVKEYKKSFTAEGKRGTIYDRNHRELAVSIDVSSIAAHPQDMEDQRRSAVILAKALNVKRRSLVKKISSDKSFVWIKRHVSPKEAEAIQELAIPGLAFVSEHRRYYPNTTLASQILGFSGTDHHGLEGIEFYYDSYLKGSLAKYKVTKDALGRRLDMEKKTEGNCIGNDLILTVDQTIQYITEKTIQETVTEFSAKSATAIVMDPKTGAILALAHSPSFNPNSFQSYNRDTWRNRAITDAFEPGSTMKIFLAAAAIESGACSPNTIFYCENGKYRIGRNVVHDTHEHDWLSLQQIVKYSSNIGAVKVTEKMGKEQLYNTLKEFGFGSRTGIDCPGETAGSLSSYRRWSKIDAGAISFGQGISVSAIQLVSAVSAIANDGMFMKPYIVHAITDENGKLLKSFAPKQVGPVISASTANMVESIMRTVTTENGTGVNAAIDKYPVCGKTGTAQKIDESGKYSEDKYIASFVGFAPEKNPRVTIIVVVDEPQKEHYGGTVAAPAFKKIAQETLNYLDLQPQNNKRPKDYNGFTVSREEEVKG